MGTAYRGEVRDVDGVTLHPSNLQGGDVYGGYGTARLANEVGATDLLVLKDPWMLTNCGPPFRDLRGGTRVTAYVPLDGRFLDDEYPAQLGFVDTFVAFTEFGRAELAASLERLTASGERTRPYRLETIPHGVDVSAFAPMDEEARRNARARLLPHVPADAYVVLNANRPVARKRIDLTIAGFARFAREAPDAYLHLHHAHRNERERAQIEAWAEASGVADRISLSEPGPLPEADFVGLYHACDVGLNTSDGEGWGLVPFEHAATGAAQVVPGNSASAELWAGAAEVVLAPSRYSPPYTPLEVAAVTPEGVAEALARLYSDPEHRQRIARAGYHRAHDPAYRWDAIAAHWSRLLV